MPPIITPDMGPDMGTDMADMGMDMGVDMGIGICAVCGEYGDGMLCCMAAE